MRQREMLNQRARQHLVEQMRLLQTYPSVARAIERGELQLHALFYQVESGLFSFYEPASGEFSCVNAQPEVRPSRQFFADS
jgi:carbonic anhydrase